MIYLCSHANNDSFDYFYESTTNYIYSIEPQYYTSHISHYASKWYHSINSGVEELTEIDDILDFIIDKKNIVVNDGVDFCDPNIYHTLQNIIEKLIFEKI